MGNVRDLIVDTSKQFWNISFEDDRSLFFGVNKRRGITHEHEVENVQKVVATIGFIALKQNGTLTCYGMEELEERFDQQGWGDFTSVSDIREADAYDCEALVHG